jgi:hypothetical protein
MKLNTFHIIMKRAAESMLQNIKNKGRRKHEFSDECLLSSSDSSRCNGKFFAWCVAHICFFFVRDMLDGDYVV